jgi:hypothetical protein
MSLFGPDIGQLRREREAKLKPFLRSRAERLSDVSGLKATDFELAAALMVAEGNVSLAQRLLVTATGVSLGPRYVSTRIKRCPKLTAFVGQLRLKNRFWANGGCCPNCGAVLPANLRKGSKHE